MKKKQAFLLMDSIYQTFNASQLCGDQKANRKPVKEIDWRVHNNEKVFGSAEEFADIPQVMRELLGKL